MFSGSKFAMVRIGPPESISKTVFPWSLGDLVRQTLEKQDLPLNMDEQEKATEVSNPLIIRFSLLL